MSYWTDYIRTPFDDVQRRQDIEHCLIVYVSGEYEAHDVEGHPEQVRITKYNGESKIYFVEQLYRELQPIAGSDEVRSILTLQASNTNWAH